MASHADWGSLHVDLLSTVLGQLSELCHEAAGGALSAADAARLLTSCSPNRHWRSVALRQVRCRMRFESKSDVAHLAKHPGLPCGRRLIDWPTHLERLARSLQALHVAVEGFYDVYYSWLEASAFPALPWC
ncbi:peptidoglycan recognition 1 [Chlorella sorokiniana]|uniref:Peptidoglycan recognition 1 n=1 Tax=Chlorella sorokiniana TaxID=3076 RepID=A0A2P6U069_CHLSO|nr:peptidoglycan recognition 1 [Chlorella sorokiniana]|eukprot:PRW59709.1 peptidoglycan recognition 1 [Chlorella sorokiniana]